MGAIEFYMFGGKLWAILPDGSNKVMTEDDADIIGYILDIIRERYPDAYKALSECYASTSLNIPYYQYLMVRRFCKCNFGSLDNTRSDIDLDGNMNFEFVACPLRGECQYECRICSPKLNSKISDSELRVMKCVCKGMTNEEIASLLFLSPNTVKNHIKSVYAKLDIHNRAEFVKYANDNELFHG